MQSRNRRFIRPLFAAAITATGITLPATGQVLAPVPAIPQPIGSGNFTVGGDEFVEAWVDIDLNIANPAIDDPTRAFPDIADAIDAVSSQVVFNIQNGLEPQEGLVHVNPGIYEIDEAIVIRPNVHIQGKDAHACIIRPSAAMSSMNVFLPTGDVCGSDDTAQVLMTAFFTQTGSGQDIVELIEGLQFQGGDIQLYINKEGPGALTFANCIFDMLPDEDTLGPEFGVLMVETWDLSIAGYHPFDASFLNNTFIQGAFFSESDVVEGVAGNIDGVALASVNNPICESQFGDPNPVLRQVYPLNIQNNLFRSIPGAPRTAMIGISEDDTTVGIGVPMGPSNAFVRGAAGGTNITGTFSSLPLGANPVPAVDVAGSDPAFVGECAQALLGSFGITFGDRRDWRLLPKSPMRDRGSTPIDTGILESVSRVAYQDYYNELRPRSAFDWDGEHYGNRRVAGGRVDIGADEANEFHLVARANDSLAPLFTWFECGLVDRPSRVRLRYNFTVPTTTAWSSPPGSRIPPLLTLAPGGGIDFHWLQGGYTVDPLQATTTFNWTNPGDGTIQRVNYFFITSLFGNSYSQLKVLPRALSPYLSNAQYTE